MSAAPPRARRRLQALEAQVAATPSASGGVLKWLSGLLGGRRASDSVQGDALLFVGCYTEATPFLFGSAGAGIVAFRVNLVTGAFTPLNDDMPIAAGANPTYLTASADGTRLYCANEAEPSQVHAFAIDPASGAPLTAIGAAQDGGGAGGCWVTLAPDEQSLLLANYSSGSAAAFPLNADGSIGPRSDLQSQEGIVPLGPNPNRQEGPHAHALVFNPASPSDCYVPDLGLDVVHHYKYTTAGQLLLQPSTSVAADGSAMGPRHMCFHPSGKFAFFNNELASMVTPVSVDLDTGGLSISGASVSSLPNDWAAATVACQLDCMFTDRPRLVSHCAHIDIHPSGRFLYCSNRGHDSIAVFTVDESDGSLERTQICLTGGMTPRNFQIHRSGTLLVVGNQDSDSIHAFTIDENTGALTMTDATIKTPSPVALCFV